jgi:mannose-1-phosphate guanylyltransferase / mannose-6-phosphate isomerase
MKLVPVVLSGGSGTRLWPLSRILHPKQFQALVTRQSLLQDTVTRLRSVRNVESPTVICSAAHRFLVAAQMERAGFPASLILEPMPRGTAPAIALAANFLRHRHGSDVLMLVLPSDHVLAGGEPFARAVEAARLAAEGGHLVTFGVVPGHPETGYGYIQADPAAPAIADGVRPVRQFVEKPDQDSARRFVQSGDYLWNSGMFLFTADVLLASLQEHAPELAAAAAAAARRAGTTGLVTEVPEAEFRLCPVASIDVAVMEKTDRAAVVALNAGWSDVGSWAALQDATTRDGDGNVLLGDVLALDTKGSYIRSERRLVAVTGLTDCIVVETADAVLVAPRNRSQDIRRLAEELERRARPEARLGREVARPWGSFDSLASGTGYQVKRLVVLPGGCLSLQSHLHRTEHWVVASGTATVTLDDHVHEMSRGQYICIPVGGRHRIENRGQDTVVVVEVQIGDYLGEDDIVRYADRYGRTGRTD